MFLIRVTALTRKGTQMRTLFISSGPNELRLGQIAMVLRLTPGFSDPVAVSFETTESLSFQPSGDLAIVLLSPDPNRGTDVLRRLRQKFAGPILAVGGVTDARLILRTMQTGADLYLDEAQLETDLEAALGRLLQKPDAVTNLGRLYTVVSACGGCGVSTLATNFGVLLAAEHGSSLLVDFNPGHGDLGALLDLRPQFSLADVCRNEERLDPAMFEKMLVRHASGVNLLAAPTENDDIKRLTRTGVSHAMILARTLFPDTVVDLGDYLHEEQQELLKDATYLYVVCRFDFTSIRGTRRLLDHLGRIGVPRGRIKLTVNQYGRPQELNMAEAENALGERISGVVPYDPESINSANNTGVPAVLKEASSPAALAIKDLLHPDRKKCKKSSGLLPSLKTFFRDVFPAFRRAE